MALNLYLLQRDDSRSYWDETVGCVVAAASKSDARSIAQAEFAREPSGAAQAWMARTTTVTEIGIAGEFVTDGVILSDHVRG